MKFYGPQPFKGVVEATYKGIEQYLTREDAVLVTGPAMLSAKKGVIAKPKELADYNKNARFLGSLDINRKLGVKSSRKKINKIFDKVKRFTRSYEFKDTTHAMYLPAHDVVVLDLGSVFESFVDYSERRMYRKTELDAHCAHELFHREIAGGKVKTELHEWWKKTVEKSIWKIKDVHTKEVYAQRPRMDVELSNIVRKEPTNEEQWVLERICYFASREAHLFEEGVVHAAEGAFQKGGSFEVGEYVNNGEEEEFVIAVFEWAEKYAQHEGIKGLLEKARECIDRSFVEKCSFADLFL